MANEETSESRSSRERTLQTADFPPIILAGLIIQPAGWMNPSSPMDDLRIVLP